MTTEKVLGITAKGELLIEEVKDGIITIASNSIAEEQRVRIQPGQELVIQVIDGRAAIIQRTL